ncbi:MAG: twin-arginine translocation signal domain-containing protein [Kiritimatiellae bacterium]|nr:twin-arginine translocation signal domain-containing protein [Kiritimatiellia bacterium]
MISRRHFLTAAAAAGCSAGYTATTPGERLVPVPNAPENGSPLRVWRPGELELHFIYTGCGESMFYRFPDGTAMVNDTGDYFRPHELQFIPRLPSAARLGGEWVTRYIQRVAPGLDTLDYMMLSHWHNDHSGAPLLRTVAARDGRRVCGLALVGENFKVKRFYDHQFPNHGQYGTDDTPGREMMEAFVAAKKREYGLEQEAFRPGARDQIRLQHDAEGRYAKTFSVRNICANGVCWTGKGEEAFDYAGAYVKATGKQKITQNALSMGFRIDYGPFSFFTGGDVSVDLAGPEGKPVDYEGLVGKMVGPVTVCKANHHSTKDAMRASFCREVKAAAYVINVWCPRHICDCNMSDGMASRALYPGGRMVFPTFIPEEPPRIYAGKDWWRDVAPGGHVVVRVAPGGTSWKVHVLESADESMKVLGTWASV